MSKSIRLTFHKLLLGLIAVLLPISVFSQSDSTYVIRGNIKNYNQTYFEMVQDGFIDWKEYNIVVDKKGTFFREIQIEGLQDFVLEINNESYTFFAKPGDTLTLTWDQKNFSKTFAIQGNEKGRTGEYKAILRCFHLRKIGQKTKKIRLMTASNIIALMLLIMKTLR